MAHSKSGAASGPSADDPTCRVESPPESPGTVSESRPLLGRDNEGRRHYITNSDQIVYVLEAETDQFEYVYDLSQRSLREWVDYVTEKCGWDHLWPSPAPARLHDEPPEPPSPEELKTHLLGIDEDGYRHYLNRSDDALFVFASDSHEVMEVYDISNANVQTWVDQVKYATGWVELRYSDEGVWAALAEQIADAVEVADGSEQGDKPELDQQ